MTWASMITAPTNRPILVRRHNDVCYEYDVVWYTGDVDYPWASNHTDYPDKRLDQWCEIPGEHG